MFIALFLTNLGQCELGVLTPIFGKGVKLVTVSSQKLVFRNIIIFRVSNKPKIVALIAVFAHITFVTHG